MGGWIPVFVVVAIVEPLESKLQVSHASLRNTRQIPISNPRKLTIICNTSQYLVQA